MRRRPGWIPALAAGLALALSFSAAAAVVQTDWSIDMTDAKELKAEWKQDQSFTLADPAPWTLEELKKAVDVHDPRSVAAYWVWSVVRLTDDYEDGMAMMKYLFADLEPYDRGFVEGGLSGKAGWDSYFNGAAAGNGFCPSRPLTLDLYYNKTNTETVNAQSLEALGRLNIVYWVRSNAGGSQANITLSRFEGSDRWYVTSGASSAALFYDQRSALTPEELALAGSLPNDGTTILEHAAYYGSLQPKY